jgi:hypothetical protein
MTEADVRAHQMKHFGNDPLAKNPAYVKALQEAKRATTPKMNKTEAEYGRILEAMKSRGEIDHYAYEGVTLSWGDGMRYKPDFAVFKEGRPPTLIEVKGGHIWSRDLVRFKGCRAEWKRWFVFEMHQKRKGQWLRLH